MVFTSNKEDKVLISRVEDIIELSIKRNKPCFLGFLNEREVYIIKSHFTYCRDNIIFYGGYNDAQRVVMCYCDYSVEPKDFPITSVCFQYRKIDNLSHRDFLGSLMGLGIERDCVGDILVNNGFAICYVKNEIYDFVTSQLSKVGRVGVKIIDPKSCKLNYSSNNELLDFSVSSLRLDVVVAAITGYSREKTRELILSQKVFTNYLVNQNVSHNLSCDDVLTIRGKGKFIIKERSGVTKKGSIKIKIEQLR